MNLSFEISIRRNRI